MILKCQFCDNLATLLCDGRLEDGRTCSANICKDCAVRKSAVHVRLTRRVNGSRGHWLTVDLCPTCNAAERETNIGGISREEAIREFAPPRNRQAKLF